MTDLQEFDATGQADLVRRGEVTPLELIDAAIASIEQWNPALNAVITPLFEKARAHAASPWLGEGPFRGVPMLLKDFLCETAGDPYFEGMKFLRDLNWHSRQDAYLAQRFRAAGFVFLGKTNLSELAGSPLTESKAFGATRNPWDRQHSAGGSSGGSAAAVAAHMVPVAHANDGTGSIRIPASCCGLVGLKPSRGRVPVGPGAHAGLLGNICEHVLSRSVRDAAAILDCIAGAVPGDPFVVPLPAQPFAHDVWTDPGTLRVGLLTHDPLLENLRPLRPGLRTEHPACAEAVRRTGRLLESLGHEVDESWPEALAGATGLGQPRGVLGASAMAAALDAWSARTSTPIGAADVEPATWALAAQGRHYSATDVHAACHRLVAGLRPVAEWWGQGHDLLVLPTMNGLPPLIGEFDRTGDDLTEWSWRVTEAFGLYTVPYSFTGQPAISLPLFSSPEGLPIGVQLVAAHGREDLLIRVAAQLEAAAPWERRRPPEMVPV